MNWLATLLPLTLNIVKLNNPQMGTETLSINQTYLFCYIHYVKLNNPQMGTETIVILIIEYRFKIIMLN